MERKFEPFPGCQKPATPEQADAVLAETVRLKKARRDLTPESRGAGIIDFKTPPFLCQQDREDSRVFLRVRDRPGQPGKMIVTAVPTYPLENADREQQFMGVFDAEGLVCLLKALQVLMGTVT